MVCGVVGGVRYDGVVKGRFSIYGSSNICGGSLYGNVTVVQGMVFLCFRCELYFRA